MDTIDIQPASLSQVRRARNGELVTITDDVANVAKDLHELFPGLRLTYSPDEDISIVWCEENGGEELVATQKGKPDQRLVRALVKAASDDYSFADELERAEQRADKRRRDEFRETIGDAGERLAHAIRTDLHDQSRVFLSAENIR